MDLPENPSESRLDEKSQDQKVENGLTQHKEVAVQQNGGDVEDPDEMGPVSYT